MKDRYDIKINRYINPVMIITKEEERQLIEILINHSNIINHQNTNYQAEENKVSVVEIMGREKYNEIRIGRDSYIANFGELSVFVKSE